MNTLELKDHALDYVLALIEGYSPGSDTKNVEIHTDNEGKVSCILVSINQEYVVWSPSTGPQGDAIIDREGISVIRSDDKYVRRGDGYKHVRVWAATIGQNGYSSSTEHQQHDPMYQLDVSDMTYGDTRREAAMRSFAVFKLGRKVEIPEQLC